MATGGGWVWDDTFIANSDMKAYQYHTVATASALINRITLGTGGSAPVCIGVLQNNPSACRSATVRVRGVTKCWASIGTAITYGDFLKSGSNGHLENVGGSTGWAIALEDLASGSAIIEVLWLGPFYAEAADNTP